MNNPKKQPLSLFSILKRNLLLFIIMLLALVVGCSVYILEVQSLSLAIVMLRAERLSFIFLILFASCYLSLLFISLKRYWINFFVQLVASISIFFLLFFIFNPIFNLKFELANYDLFLSTRSWSKVQIMPIRSNIAYFTWLQLPDQDNQLFPNGVVCLAKKISYFGNFTVVTSYRLPYSSYMDNQGELGVACNNETFHLIGQTVNLEKALMNEDYALFERLDLVMQGEPWYNKPLVITADQLPRKLRSKIYQYADALSYNREKLLIRPAFIQAVLDE